MVHTFDKKAFKKQIKENVKLLYRKEFEEANDQEVYQAVALAVKDEVIDNWLATQKTMEKKDPKTVYYMSMEFLMGRALGNNMLNLCCYDEISECLDELGFDINAIEDQEPDPALGNGGLGRLAACFMDSLSTLGYPAYGCGIRYRYGMFKQKIEDGYQKEVPDNWLKNGYPFEIKRPEYAHEVRFGGYVRTEQGEDGNLHFIHEGYSSVIAVPYDMPIVGYDNNMVNTLMIWDAEPKEVFRLDSFDKGEYDKAVEEENLARNLVEVLYPNDNHIYGKELRLKQQYFFVSASLQRILCRYKKHHDDIRKLYEKVTIQMNGAPETVSEGEETCMPDARDNTVVVINSDRMGSGNDELGKVLIKGFIFAITQLDTLPKTMLFYNGGATLTTEGSDSLEDLKSLEAQGVQILTCGTCLDYYGLKEKLVVGTVTNMYSIVETMAGAGKIIRP